VPLSCEQSLALMGRSSTGLQPEIKTRHSFKVEIVFYAVVPGRLGLGLAVRYSAVGVSSALQCGGG